MLSDNANRSPDQLNIYNQQRGSSKMNEPLLYSNYLLVYQPNFRAARTPPITAKNSTAYPPSMKNNFNDFF